MRTTRILSKRIVTKLCLAAISLMMLCTMIHPILAPTTYTLNPIADTFVCSLTPDTNYGIYGMLFVRYDTVMDEWTYLKFEIPTYQGKAIVDAELKLFCRWDGNLPNQPPWADLDVCECTPACQWTELGLTWNNKARARPLVMLARTSVNGIGTWYSWRSDALTQYVDFNRGGQMDLILAFPTQGANPKRRAFTSINAPDTVHWPKLIITTNP